MRDIMRMPSMICLSVILLLFVSKANGQIAYQFLPADVNFLMTIKTSSIGRLYNLNNVKQLAAFQKIDSTNRHNLAPIQYAFLSDVYKRPKALGINVKKDINLFIDLEKDYIISGICMALESDSLFSDRVKAILYRRQQQKQSISADIDPKYHSLFNQQNQKKKDDEKEVITKKSGFSFAQHENQALMWGKGLAIFILIDEKTKKKSKKTTAEQSKSQSTSPRALFQLNKAKKEKALEIYAERILGLSFLESMAYINSKLPKHTKRHDAFIQSRNFSLEALMPLQGSRDYGLFRFSKKVNQHQTASHYAIDFKEGIVATGSLSKNEADEYLSQDTVWSQYYEKNSVKAALVINHSSGKNIWPLAGQYLRQFSNNDSSEFVFTDLENHLKAEGISVSHKPSIVNIHNIIGKKTNKNNKALEKITTSPKFSFYIPILDSVQWKNALDKLELATPVVSLDRSYNYDFNSETISGLKADFNQRLALSHQSYRYTSKPPYSI